MSTRGSLGMPEALPQTMALTVSREFCSKAILVGIVHITELVFAVFGHWPQLVALIL